jgi:hypothetical protein
MKFVLLVIGLLTALAFYYGKRIGVVAGLIAMLIIIEYPIKIKDFASKIGETCEKEDHPDHNEWKCY